MNIRRTGRLARLTLAAPIAVTAMFGVAATALAATDTTVYPPFPAATFCGNFDVTLTVTDYDNGENSEPDKTGNKSTGHEVATFTGNGKSVTFNVSGSSTAPTFSGNTATEIFTGPSWFAIGPKGRANTGEPPILYAPGRTVVVYDTSQHPPVVLSFSHDGPVTDICALLRN